MTVDEMIEVLQAYKEGKTIQYKSKTANDDFWEDSVWPSFSFIDCDYRVKPEEPDYINWDHVHSDFDFLVRNKNGMVFIFESRPMKDSDVWYTPKGEVRRATAFASYKRGTVSWENSLVERPKK